MSFVSRYAVTHIAVATHMTKGYKRAAHTRSLVAPEEAFGTHSVTGCTRNSFEVGEVCLVCITRAEEYSSHIENTDIERPLS